MDLREYTGKVIVDNGRNYSKPDIRAVNGFGLKIRNSLIWDCEKMRGEPVELACPFCDKGKIQCWYIPGAVSVKQNRSRVLKGSQKVKSSDVWLVQSDCSVCGKSKEDVEKELVKRKII